MKKKRKKAITEKVKITLLRVIPTMTCWHAPGVSKPAVLFFWIFA